MSTITVEDFIGRARSWKGVPFRHQGRSRLGVDCIGLPEAILREAGVLPRAYRVRANYGRLPARQLAAGLARWCTEIPAPEPGALIAIRWPKATAASHVAIFTDATIIHAYRDETGVVEHGYRGKWVAWTVSFWRLPGVRYE